MANRTVKFGPYVAAGVGVILSGCTGSDMSIAMGPNGPVPPENVGSISSYGAPPSQMSAPMSSQAYPAPLQASPSGSIASSPLPVSSRIDESPLAPPSRRIASASPSSNMQWSVGAQPVGRENEAPPPPIQSQVASLPEPAMDEADQLPPPIDEEQASLSDTAGQPPLRPASMRGQDRPGPSAGRTEIQVLPVVGAPQQTAELLARALSEEAGPSGVHIRPASESVAPIRLKGYFSAFTDGNATVLVYVWDVLDASDQRVRRIQGQESIAGTSADPWAKVDLETLRKVSRETMQQAASAS